jgi:uncharacterized protein YceH (UPF0502 family)
MLPLNLEIDQLRVLGALIEKELSTPDHYPLSLNALTNACNQSSNRNPVMKLSENTVSDAVTALRHLNLVRSVQASGSRVPRFQHLLAEATELSKAEMAVLCVLILRGPQTAAEIRSRSARLVPANDGTAIPVALDTLMELEPTPLVSRLPRRAGQKESRFAHMLGGEVIGEGEDAPPAAPNPAVDRIAALEELTAELRNEVDDLRSELASFRKQFE